MASATAVAPPATDPAYRKPLEPTGPAAASAPALDRTASVELREAGSRAGARRVAVILHGKRADEADVRAAVRKLREEGTRVDVKVTWESGDVAKFVKDILRAHSADTIVAAGGDGTLNEVVAALIQNRGERSVGVGLMPMGTSNDFAAVTGLPQDLEGALRLCCRSDNLRSIDVGLLNGEVFMNTATLGASSELGSETSHEAKAMLGPAAYLVKGVARLVSYEAMPVRMRCPAPDPRVSEAQGRQRREREAREAGSEAGEKAKAGEASTSGEGASGAAAEGRTGAGGKEKGREGKKGRRGVMELNDEVLNLTAGNNRQLASMVQACPDALLDDGLLDVTYVTGTPVQGASSLVGEILSKGLDAAAPGNVHMLRVPWIEVELLHADPRVTWPGNRDGEPVPPGRKFRLEALPRRVTMHLPEGAAHLLTEGADPRVNAPVASINRLRKGAFKAMLAQVTRFKRVIPGMRPWWQAAALRLLSRAPPLLLAAGLGYALARRASSSSASSSPAEGKKAERRGRKEVEVEESGGGGGRKWSRLPAWPRRSKRGGLEAAAVEV